MASFTITFEDTEDGGIKSTIEIKGFKNSSSKTLAENTCVQNIFFAVNNFMVKDLGIKIPQIDAADANAQPQCEALSNETKCSGVATPC